MTANSMDPVARVAQALGRTLLERVVFIGGSIAPLLQVDPPFPRARPTKDVDAIVATVGYGNYESITHELRRQGFRELGESNHAHTWLTPGDTPIKFDLVPAGTHLGASGNPWDSVALENWTPKDLEEGLTIRHVTAPAFICLKFSAFNDRGIKDPFASHDLEDVLAIIVSRPHIVEEIGSAPQDVRHFIRGWVERLLRNSDIDELLYGHLGNSHPTSVAATVAVARQRLEAIAGEDTE
jgi:hypothetical protein